MMTVRRPTAQVAHRSTGLTDREFFRFQRLVEESTGIHLPLWKKTLVVSRLARRLRELGLGSYGAYYRRVTEEGDALERTRMIDAITTNETRFFREEGHYRFLLERWMPALEAEASAGRRPRRLRVWSAACSTGEEPYSVAMVLLAGLVEPFGWTVEVWASDISSRVLERAEAGLWAVEKATQIPQAYRRRYMLRGVGPQEGWMKAGPTLRATVRFVHDNLVHDRWKVPGPAELVLCSNVLIYFAPETRRRVVERLVDHVEPGGVLMVGHSESLALHTRRLQPVEPMIYRRPHESGPR